MSAKPLKVGLISYPILFQSSGGLQVQMLETLAALQRAGVAAALVNPLQERFDSYDVLHVFAVINGNDRIVRRAKAMGCTVVLSPLIRPSWTRGLGTRARMLDRVVGRLTRWAVHTEYGQIEAALSDANAIVGLGSRERECIESAFNIAGSKVHVVPNGIREEFFSAAPAFFRSQTGIAERFVLNVATIDTHKNQLALVEALRDSGLLVVLIGEVLPGNRPYLERLLRYDHVRYLGVFEPGAEMLRSAYAAASAFALPSRDEVMPLAVMESLAAGTPVVMTRNHCMDLDESSEVVIEVDPLSQAAIRSAVLQLLERSYDAETVRSLVRGMSWDSVAGKLLSVYRQVCARADLQEVGRRAFA